MAGRLQGKTALVTGATSGIGLETARLFAAEGATVIVHGRDADRLAAIRDELGGDTLALQGSIDSVAEIERMIAEIATRHERLDVLFANAGIFRPLFIEEIDEATFEELYRTNVKGTFFTVQKALPLLGPGSSVVFNTTAMIGIGVPSSGVYVATKAAVRSLVRVFAAEIGPRGIRFNTVSPGSIITPLHGHSSLEGEARDRVAAAIMARTPAGRYGEASEVAKAVLFLASDEASFVQGDEILVAGGWGSV